MCEGQGFGYCPGNQSRFHHPEVLLQERSLFMLSIEVLLILMEVHSIFCVVTDQVEVMPVFPVILVQWVLLLKWELTPSRS